VFYLLTLAARFPIARVIVHGEEVDGQLFVTGDDIQPVAGAWKTSGHIHFPNCAGGEEPCPWDLPDAQDEQYVYLSRLRLELNGQTPAPVSLGGRAAAGGAQPPASQPAARGAAMYVT
jgi:hypothetical protein